MRNFCRYFVKEGNEIKPGYRSSSCIKTAEGFRSTEVPTPVPPAAACELC